jgi:hypothetical protein
VEATPPVLWGRVLQKVNDLALAGSWPADQNQNVECIVAHNGSPPKDNVGQDGILPY